MFGPRPRNYGFKLNKKVKALARRSALTYKAQNNQIMVIEDIKFDAPKTKEFVNITRNLKLEGQKLLLVLARRMNWLAACMAWQWDRASLARACSRASPTHQNWP